MTTNKKIKAQASLRRLIQTMIIEITYPNNKCKHLSRITLYKEFTGLPQQAYRANDTCGNDDLQKKLQALICAIAFYRLYDKKFTLQRIRVD